MGELLIQKYDDSFERVWKSMFFSYSIEDLESGLQVEVIEKKICKLILDSYHSGILSICLACLNDATIGFALYQIDTPENDWCKREGWGFIREFYIRPTYRKQGYGKYLCQYVEEQLYKMGASSLYLTADEAVPFWEHCGYVTDDGYGASGLRTLVKRGNCR